MLYILKNNVCVPFWSVWGKLEITCIKVVFEQWWFFSRNEINIRKRSAISSTFYHPTANFFSLKIGMILEKQAMQKRNNF